MLQGFVESRREFSLLSGLDKKLVCHRRKFGVAVFYGKSWVGYINDGK
jgi:hypothetical protein